MSTVKVEIQLSSQKLPKAVEQLSLTDLEQFVSQVLLLQAQRKAHNLPQTEAELLQKILIKAFLQILRRITTN